MKRLINNIFYIIYMDKPCKMCGVSFISNRKTNCCSDECRKEHRKIYSREYIRKRYQEDELFRNKIKESVRKYTEKNKEKIKRYKQKYREKRKEQSSKNRTPRKTIIDWNDPKQVKEYKKKHREKNREKNKEKAKAYSKKYYQDNKEIILKRSQKYYQENKERINKNRQRLSHKQLEEIGKIAVRQQVLPDIDIRDKPCVICNATESLVVHHITYSPQETVVLCYQCHAVLHHRFLNGEQCKPRILR